MILEISGMGPSKVRCGKERSDSHLPSAITRAILSGIRTSDCFSVKHLIHSTTPVLGFRRLAVSSNHLMVANHRSTTSDHLNNHDLVYIR